MANLATMKAYLNGLASSSHNILPALLRYILTINISTVNTERSFSKLKLIQNTKYQSLKAETAASKVLISSVINAFDTWLILERLFENYLSDLLNK